MRTLILILLFQSLSLAVGLNSDSLFEEGLKYYYGNGVEMDKDQALHFFEQASFLNHKEAKYYLAIFYLNKEERNEEDVKKALEFLKQASELGLVDATYYLGVLLLYGEEGVESDKEQGLAFLEQAAELGHTEAAFILDDAYIDESNAFYNEPVALEE